MPKFDMEESHWHVLQVEAKGRKAKSHLVTISAVAMGQASIPASRGRCKGEKAKW
jgi:hypothetical protein